MFWQGGGRKRLKQQIDRAMEVSLPEIDKFTVGRSDDELFIIYYNRDQNEQRR